MFYALINDLKKSNLISSSNTSDLHEIYNLLYSIQYDIDNKKEDTYKLIVARFLGFIDSDNNLTKKGEELVSHGDFLSKLVTALHYSDIGKILCPFNKVSSLLDIEEVKIPFEYLDIDENLNEDDKRNINRMVNNWVQEYKGIIKAR